jgi:hypothetical protein
MGALPAVSIKLPFRNLKSILVLNLTGIARGLPMRRQATENGGNIAQASLVIERHFSEAT